MKLLAKAEVKVEGLMKGKALPALASLRPLLLLLAWNVEKQKNGFRMRVKRDSQGRLMGRRSRLNGWINGIAVGWFKGFADVINLVAGFRFGYEQMPLTYDDASFLCHSLLAPTPSRLLKAAFLTSFPSATYEHRKSWINTKSFFNNHLVELTFAISAA